MSDELHTYIEPELEARVTSLILGEASEFEAAELKRLIDDNPELNHFYHRTKVIHELIHKTTHLKHDTEWQLSDDKRTFLHKAFTEKKRRPYRHKYSLQ